MIFMWVVIFVVMIVIAILNAKRISIRTIFTTGIVALLFLIYATYVYVRPKPPFNSVGDAMLFGLLMFIPLLLLPFAVIGIIQKIISHFLAKHNT